MVTFNKRNGNWLQIDAYFQNMSFEVLTASRRGALKYELFKRLSRLRGKVAYFCDKGDEYSGSLIHRLYPLQTSDAKSCTSESMRLEREELCLQ